MRKPRELKFVSENACERASTATRCVLVLLTLVCDCSAYRLASPAVSCDTSCQELGMICDPNLFGENRDAHAC
jgi:hypothetical protein